MQHTSEVVIAIHFKRYSGEGPNFRRMATSQLAALWRHASDAAPHHAVHQITPRAVTSSFSSLFTTHCTSCAPELTAGSRGSGKSGRAAHAGRGAAGHLGFCRGELTVCTAAAAAAAAAPAAHRRCRHCRLQPSALPSLPAGGRRDSGKDWARTSVPGGPEGHRYRQGRRIHVGCWAAECWAQDSCATLAGGHCF